MGAIGCPGREGHVSSLGEKNIQEKGGCPPRGEKRRRDHFRRERLLLSLPVGEKRPVCRGGKETKDQRSNNISVGWKEREGRLLATAKKPVPMGKEKKPGTFQERRGNLFLRRKRGKEEGSSSSLRKKQSLTCGGASSRWGKGGEPLPQKGEEGRPCEGRREESISREGRSR